MRRMWACRAVLLAVLCYAYVYTVHSMLESDEDDVPPTQSEEMTTLDSTTCDATPSDIAKKKTCRNRRPRSPRPRHRSTRCLVVVVVA